MTDRPRHPVVPNRFGRRGRALRAFTLIEVLATLLLLAIALPAVLRGISMATSAASQAKHRGDAYGLCQSKLNELLATGQWQNGNLAGDFNPDNPGYRWSASTLAWTDPSVEQLDVHVIWTGRGKEQDVVLSTLVYPNSNPSNPGADSPSTGTTGTPGTSGTSGTSSAGGKR